MQCIGVIDYKSIIFQDVSNHQIEVFTEFPAMNIYSAKCNIVW